jgi:acyl-[acyl-carrier-protein]-phospholipid O-acyltransferase/long-chain-fatty-acid--[acyl-carrier-protein] ligase
MLGTGSALLIRQVQPSSPELPFDPEVLGVPRDIRHLLRADRSLWYALVVSTIFWLSAAIVQPAVNALGERQLNENKLYTGILVTVISAGIAAGSVLAGVASRGKINSRVQKTGAWGMVATLFLLALPGGPKQHLLGYWGSVVDLVLLGAFTGMFAVPLQVFLQSRPPEGQKGRMIATQNLFNWIGICCSTAIYGAGTWLLSLLNVPGNGIFALTALLMLPIALFYRPQSRDLALSAIRE